VKQLAFLLLVLTFFSPLCAEEFKVASVIHPVVSKMSPPKATEAFRKGHMAVSTSSEKAAEHVAQGMVRLNTSWDFEAYRHFCEAAKLDPDCLMAYWGITMSLAGSEHEFFEQRQIAVNRMLDLLESEAANEGERWTDIERGYVQGAGALLTEGVRGAGVTFKAVSKRFPLDIQSKLFSLFLLRDGYDEFGKPLVGQLQTNAGLFEILKANPENLSVMAFWVSSQSEAPLNGPGLRNDVLPIARKLVRLHPDYPPFQLMLTHVELRCGNAALAIQSALEAVKLYQAYMSSNKVSVFDCEGWVRSKLYLVNLYETKGEHDKALAISKELATVNVSKERLFSRGAGLLMWEGRTAGARIMMGQTDKASFYEGQKILEILPEEEWYKKKSFALFYRDCLAFYLGVRIAVSVKDLENGKVLYKNLIERARALEGKQELASKTSSYSSWLRATNTLGIAIAELRGMLAELESGATKLSAKNWYIAAADRQGRTANLLPHTIDYPMELRLGDFHFSQGDFKSARKSFREGLNVRPNHLQTLRGYHKSLVKLGRVDDAALLAKRIKAVAN
jgi:tetratricopeptide (TPR) repeat protein|tara:strand:- start:299 stop:1987 length:1689 start_codon:yes stop_codon:yes gene_type:complete